jgi:NAD(P)H-dependent flavin oxidoreductase YrpB (nitropropane dioxygenase family)
MATTTKLRTPLCDLLGIEYPVMLAGMASVSGSDLAAAVSNAGGIGSFGGVSMSPSALRNEIKYTKELLEPGKPFGVDLLLPQVGSGARKTNKDYTGGTLGELIDILIEEKVKLFISAVGVPPTWVVEKLHAAGIVVANMVGAPHHVPKALAVGVDLIIAQGTEAGGHTGDVATLPLIPQCVDLCRGKKNFFGSDVLVVAAGGIYDGRGLSASLCLGAAGVWVGTRFIACEEANSSMVHKKRVVEATSVNTTRTEAFTGRPCRVMQTPYVKSWMERPEELRSFLQQGRIPYHEDVSNEKASHSEFFPALMGQVAGAIKDIKPARAIVEEMVADAVKTLSMVTVSKL